MRGGKNLRNRLVYWISLHEAALSKTSVVKHFLYIVKGEATKDGKTTIQPDVLSERQSANSSSWEDQWSKSGNSNNGNTSKEWSTKVQVLVGLSGSTDKGDRTHHSNGVKTSPGHDSWRCHEHQWSDEESLSSVESSPESVFLDIVIWIRSTSSHHGSERQSKTTDHDNPWVGGHQSVDEAGLVNGPGGNTDNSNSQSCVQERLVQVCALKQWHSTILAGLAVEDNVDGEESSTEDCASVEHTAHKRALVYWCSWLLDIVGASLSKDALEYLVLLQWRGGAGCEEGICWLWNALTAGAEDLKAVFEVWARTPVRRIGWRSVKAMLKCFSG